MTGMQQRWCNAVGLPLIGAIEPVSDGLNVLYVVFLWARERNELSCIYEVKVQWLK